MPKPFMDEDLSGYRLSQILEVIDSQTEALSVPQIQRRLEQRIGEDVSRAEIEAHLRWGSNQPNATMNPTYPVRDYSTGKWLVADRSYSEEGITWRT